MSEKRNFTQCRMCKYFVEDDESLKTLIEYCIILGASLDTSGNCEDFVALDKKADAELVG